MMVLKDNSPGDNNQFFHYAIGICIKFEESEDRLGLISDN